MCREWCGHDEADVTFYADGIVNLFQEPSFLVLIRHRHNPIKNWFTVLQVYDLESHQELKSIDLSGKSYDLLTNESVVVSVTGKSALIFNKKMLFDPKIPPEAIKSQEISILPSSQLSISRTSIVLAPKNKGEMGTLQALNFWLERDQLEAKEHPEGDQEAE